MSDFTDFAIPKECHWCHKPPAASLPFTLRWNGKSYTSIHLLNGSPAPEDMICHGHKSVECSECGWMVAEGYHTSEECERLGTIVGKRKKTIIPQAFLDAFSNDEGTYEQQ